MTMQSGSVQWALPLSEHNTMVAVYAYWDAPMWKEGPYS